MNSSQRLRTYSDSVLNDVTHMTRTVDAINASDVAPAAALCAGLQPQLSAMQIKASI